MATTRRCSTCSACPARSAGARVGAVVVAREWPPQLAPAHAGRAVPARARRRVAGAARRRRRWRRARRSGRMRARCSTALRARGASFFSDLAAAVRPRSRCAAPRARRAGRCGPGRVGRLLRAARAAVAAAHGRPGRATAAANFAGRWTAAAAPRGRRRDAARQAVEPQAWALLRRYGVVFRRLLTREPNAAPWRELTRVYRRLEARGEIRGGRFVSGMAGEQFALPDAVERLREVRRTPPTAASSPSAPPIRSTWPASSPPASGSAPPAATAWSTATVSRWR